MKVTNILLVVWFLLLTSPALAIVLKDVVAEFSYYKLALQWPNSLCNQDNYCIQNKFSIHGLWPFWANNSIVEPCPGRVLTSSQVRGIETLLKQYWPNLYGSNDFGFWKYEWMKHGRCLGLEPSVYFTDAIDLRKRFFNDSRLVQQGFRPSADPYKLITLYNKLRQANGAKGQLKCNITNRPYRLVEVHICFDRQKNLRDCPYRFSTCGQDDQALVLFPSSSTIVPGPLQGVSLQKRNGWAGPRPSWTNYWTSSFPLLVVFLYVI